MAPTFDEYGNVETGGKTQHQCHIGGALQVHKQHLGNILLDIGVSLVPRLSQYRFHYFLANACTPYQSTRTDTTKLSYYSCLQ